jgi:hypothetical protein
MNNPEIQKKYAALSEEQREEFDAKMEEFATNLLQGGPHDTAHWPKVPPSPIIEVADEKVPLQRPSGSQSVVFPHK